MPAVRLTRSTARANPKSRTSATVRPVAALRSSSMFGDLMSRCRMLQPCRYRTASAVSRITSMRHCSEGRAAAGPLLRDAVCLVREGVSPATECAGAARNLHHQRLFDDRSHFRGGHFIHVPNLLRFTATYSLLYVPIVTVEDVPSPILFFTRHDHAQLQYTCEGAFAVSWCATQSNYNSWTDICKFRLWRFTARLRAHSRFSRRNQ
jgi:hypothetical protein